MSPGVSIATHRRGNRVNNATTDRDAVPAPGQRCVYDYSVARREALHKISLSSSDDDHF